MKNTTRLHLAFGFIALYILSIPLGTMLTFELLGNNVQLPEVVYLPLLVYTLLNFRLSILKKMQWNGLDTAVTLYGTSVFLAWAIHRTHNAFGEVVACGYLMSLYGVLRYWQVWKNEPACRADRYQTKEAEKSLFISLFNIRYSIFNIHKIVLYSGYLAAITGIIGYFLAFFGIYDLVRLDGNYPFLGEVYRVKGFFANPIFFVTHVGCVLLAPPQPSPKGRGLDRSEPSRFQELFCFKRSLLRWLESRFSLPFGEGWGGAVVVFALLLTKIKSLLSIFGILCLIFAWFTPKPWLKYSSVAVGTVAIVAYLFFSHWLILDKNSRNFEATLREPFYSTNHTWTPLGSHYVLMPTFYTARKELATILGTHAFPWGIGGNELYVVQDSILEANGMDLMRETAPHSTYWGVFAELGLLGMIAIFALFGASFQAVRTKFDVSVQPYYLGLLGFLFLEAVTVDLMNVRILWVFLFLVSSSGKFRN